METIDAVGVVAGFCSSTGVRSVNAEAVRSAAAILDALKLAVVDSDALKSCHPRYSKRCSPQAVATQLMKGRPRCLKNASLTPF